MTLFFQSLGATAEPLAEFEFTNDGRVTQVYATTTVSSSKPWVTQLYTTITVVVGAFKVVCPAIAVGVANILAERVVRFFEVVCPAIAAPVANISFTRPYSNIICPAIAKPIPFCEYLYKPRPPTFTGGAGVIAAVLPRRQTVSTRALRRRRRRTSRRSR